MVLVTSLWLKFEDVGDIYVAFQCEKRSSTYHKRSQTTVTNIDDANLQKIHQDRDSVTNFKRRLRANSMLVTDIGDKNVGDNLRPNCRVPSGTLIICHNDFHRINSIVPQL